MALLISPGWDSYNVQLISGGTPPIFCYVIENKKVRAIRPYGGRRVAVGPPLGHPRATERSNCLVSIRGQVGICLSLHLCWCVVPRNRGACQVTKFVTQPCRDWATLVSRLWRWCIEDLRNIHQPSHVLSPASRTSGRPPFSTTDTSDRGARRPLPDSRNGWPTSGKEVRSNL